jgi:hypothetical protein
MFDGSINASENIMNRCCKWNSISNLDRSCAIGHSCVASALQWSRSVAENATVRNDRRGVSFDRRKKSRGGRRTTDPRTAWRWRRLAWLFGAYAVYWSVRALPSTVKRYFNRTETPAS